MCGLGWCGAINPQAHSGEMWGVSAHPLNDDLYITCADEGRVMLWSVAEKRLLKSAGEGASFSFY